MRSLLLFGLVTLSFTTHAQTLQKVADKIEEEWMDLTIKQNPQVRPNINVGGLGSAQFGLAYHYMVTPAYLRDQHQRIDGYSVKVGALVSPLQLGIGRSAEAQISFSRLFSQKQKALFSPPRSPQKFPFQTEKALNDLTIGSAARLELASDGHIGAVAQRILESSLSPLPAQFSASVHRGKRYIIDVYRIDKDRVRLRLLATRNMGSFGTKGALTPLTNFNFGLGFVDYAFDHLFRCQLISVERETSINELLPVDTMMVDYVINLTTSAGEQTYNAFFTNLLQMDVLEQLSLFETPEVFYSSLWDYARVIDDVFQQQKGIVDPKMRAIHRGFKGRTLTDFRRVSLESGCFHLWDVDRETYHGTTSVREFDDADQTKDYFYLGTQNLSERNFLFGLFDEQHSLGFNTLFHAVREEESNPLSVTPTGLSDLVLVRSFKDKKFFGSNNPFFKNEVALFKKDLYYQYPQFFSEIDWRDFIKTKKVAYSRMEMVFDRRTVSLIRQKQLTESDLKIHLKYYIEGYIKYVHPSLLSTSVGGKNHDPKSGQDRFQKDMQFIARRLALIFGPQTTVETAVKAFSSLRKNPLFQDIGAGFILTLIPAQQVKSVVEVSLSVGAKDTPTVEVSSKSDAMTHLYRQVEQILGTINDRSFDLRLQKEIGALEQ